MGREKLRGLMNIICTYLCDRMCCTVTVDPEKWH